MATQIEQRLEDIPQIFGGAAPEGAAPDDDFLDDETLQAILATELQDARSFIDDEVGPVRADATARYNAEPYGDEEEGRSRIVMTDVRDSTYHDLPSLMRVFCGSERAVEFVGRSAGDSAAAEQRTAVVNYVIFQQNEGITEFYKVLKDALVRMVGFVKYWKDDKLEVSTETYTGLTEGQMLTLVDDESVQSATYEKTGDVTLETGESVPVHSVTVQREAPANRYRYQLCPGEEIIVDRRATSKHDARVVAHQTYLTRSELIAMGYDADFLDEHAGTSFFFESNQEFLSRRPSAGQATQDMNPAMGTVLYTEAWVRVARDPKKPAELTKVCAIGEGFFIARTEPAQDIPIVCFATDPEPAQFFGGSNYHLVRDLQRINTNVMRSTLDSLSLAIHPRMEVDENAVNLEDVQNSEIGAIVRTRRMGSVLPIKTEFVGASGLQVLDWLKTTREERTGQTKASQGIDADQLQSTTKAAVTGALSAAQARVELKARLLAEGFKELFKGIQRLLMRHQDVPMTVRVHGEFIEVDPRTWHSEMDVIINVGLGRGAPEDQLALLMGIKETQENLMLQSPGNPLVGFPEYRYTLQKIVQLGGFPDTTRFFKAIPADWQPPEQGESKPSPEEILAQAQREQIQASIQIEAAKLELERQDMWLKDARERDKALMDVKVKMMEIEAKTRTDLNEQQVTAAAELQARESEAIADTLARAHQAETQARALPAGEAPA